MISYWVTESGRFGIDAYRQNRGLAIADRFQTRLYDHIGDVVQLTSGAQVFSALDHLTEAQKDVVAAIWDGHAVAAPEATRLNDPRRVHLRFPLLKTLHEQKLNSYRVFRARDLEQVDTFPVFVRHMYDHSGPRTRLLNTRREVGAALFALRLRGYRLRDLMIVEFCNTSNRDGLFRKFSAFKVGKHIIPCHLLVSNYWCVKSARSQPTEESLREGIEFVDANPHHDWLRRVFAVGGVDYGRVDYGVLDGTPQVWEINLNPTIGRVTGWQGNFALPAAINTLREHHREAFHARLRAAFVALDTGETQAVSVGIGESLLKRVRAESAAIQRRARFLGGVSELSGHPQLGLAIRAVLKLFPR